jgi:hypothetical protein
MNSYPLWPFLSNYLTSLDNFIGDYWYAKKNYLHISRISFIFDHAWECPRGYY